MRLLWRVAGSRKTGSRKKRWQTWTASFTYAVISMRRAGKMYSAPETLQVEDLAFDTVGLP
jgi:hypothetical protein